MFDLLAASVCDGTFRSRAFWTAASTRAPWHSHRVRANVGYELVPEDGCVAGALYRPGDKGNQVGLSIVLCSHGSFVDWRGLAGYARRRYGQPRLPLVLINAAI